MPTIVHGNDGFTGFQIHEESAWGTLTGGSWINVPIIGETLHTVYDQTPSSPEFGGIGSQTSADTINKRVEGEVRISPRLDAQWFHWFMGHIFGEETRTADVGLDGTGDTGGNTHWYRMNNTFRSLAARAWKGGPSTGGYWSEFSGLVVSTARFEWNADGLLTVVLAFIGRSEATALTTGSLGTPTGAITAKARWLTNTGANFQTGSTLANRDVRSFTINIDRRITADPAFLNAVDTPNQPGPTENRVVTCDIGRFLVQDWAASGMPMNEFLAQTASKCRIRIRDTVLAGTTGRYGMDIDFPSIVWTAGVNSLAEAGAEPENMSFQAIEGATAAPAQGNQDVRIGIFVDDAADADDHYSEDAGNVVQT